MIDSETTAKISIAEMIDAIIRGGFYLSLHYADGYYLASAYRDQRNRTFEAENLEDCIEALTSNPRTKICRKPDCVHGGKPVPLSCFTPDKDSADRHQSECKSCASKRVSRHTQKKRKEREKANAVQPAQGSGDQAGPQEQGAE